MSDSLNRTFYQQNGPADYLLMRLYNLAVVGGAQEAFKEILAQGVEYEELKVILKEVDDISDEEGSQSDDAFRNHFLRIEVHHLKHLAIETLLRLFLGHRGLPMCPWIEISGETNPGRFKRSVTDHLINGDPPELVSDVLEIMLGLPRASNSDDHREIGNNLAELLRFFALEWLDEAKSYNATKHGLTAIPGDASFSVGPQGKEPTTLGHGDSLTHLTYEASDGVRE